MTSTGRGVAILVVASCVASTAVMGCRSDSKPGASGAGGLNLLVTTEWLADHLNDSGVVILHVAQTPDRYAAGHIPGARLALWSDFAMERNRVPNEMPPLDRLVSWARRLGIETTHRIVLYDESTGIAAARAYVTLDYLGMGDRTALLDGHLAQWLAESRPTSIERPETKPSGFVPRFRPEVTVELQDMRDWVSARSEFTGVPVTIIDARPEAEYTGASTGQGVVRGGHIPGAVHVYWQNNIVSPEKPVLRSHGELDELYAKAGVKRGQPVVVYCRSGGQASHAYFTLRHLGYDVRLYDGSFLEWSHARDTPVETGGSTAPAETQSVR